MSGMEDDTLAIQKAVAESAAATNVGGIEGARGYASFAAPNATWMPPGSPPIVGRQAIESYVLAFTRMKAFRIGWDHSRIVVAKSGDIAYSVGTYEGEGLDDAGARQVFSGKVVDVWHKQADGSWKIAVAIWNTNENPT
jgi:ketosteroid isomerase-like protein